MIWIVCLVDSRKMTKYALYKGRKSVKVADNLEGWNFHPYRGNKGFIIVTDEQASRLEGEFRKLISSRK